MTKKILTSFLIFSTFLFFNAPPVFAATNTYAIDLERDGTDFLSIADASQTGLDLAGDFSICTSFKQESAQTGALVGKGTDTGSQIAYHFWISGGKPALDVSSDGTTNAGQFLRFSTDAEQSANGSFKSLCVTFDIDGEAAVFYTDGSSVASSLTFGSAIGATLKDSTAAFQIGTDGHVGGPLDGIFDEVSVWNITLSAANITSYYNSCLNGDETGLVGYWRFENDYADTTANNNDLTANGASPAPTFVTDPAFACAGGAAATKKIPDLIWFW